MLAFDRHEKLTPQLYETSCDNHMIRTLRQAGATSSQSILDTQSTHHMITNSQISPPVADSISMVAKNHNGAIYLDDQELRQFA